MSHATQTRAQVAATPAVESHPSWCQFVGWKGFQCGSVHLAELNELAATAGEFTAQEDGALFPLVTIYAKTIDGQAAVGVELYPRTSDARTVNLTPAQARQVAGYLTAQAGHAATGVASEPIVLGDVAVDGFTKDSDGEPVVSLELLRDANAPLTLREARRAAAVLLASADLSQQD